MQESILTAQRVLAELQCMSEISQTDIYITRQEAADLMGKSLRQMDRDCKTHNIRRRTYNNGIRVSKRDVLIHIGALTENGVATEKLSDLEKLHHKFCSR